MENFKLDVGWIALIVSLVISASVTYSHFNGNDKEYSTKIEQINRSVSNIEATILEQNKTLHMIDIYDVRINAIEKMIDQQQKVMNILTVNFAKMEEQRSASISVIKEMSSAIRGLTRSQGKVAVALGKLGVRIDSIERRVESYQDDVNLPR